MYNRLDGDKLLNDNRRRERTLIVGLELTMDTIDIDTSLDELQELVQAAGGVVVSRIVQKRDSIHPAYFIGKGKVEEIRLYCEELDIDAVVFNDELSGAQIRNLEKIIDKKIVDRTNLILDIFAPGQLQKRVSSR